MTEKFNKAIKMLMDADEKEHGNNYLEDGESLVGVFNDAVIIIEKEGRQPKIKCIVGEPYKFDFNLDLLQE